MPDWPTGVFLRSEALPKFGPHRIRHWLRTGAWVRLDRGLYASVDHPFDAADHVRSVLAAVGPELVVVRESAAILHGFGVLEPGVVHLAGGPAMTARQRPGVSVHGWDLPAADIQRRGEVWLTTPARTAIDITRLVSRLDALATLDAVLRGGGCDRDDLAKQLTGQHRMRGIVQARQLVPWADERAESPMESRTRMRLIDGGLPPPELQWWVYDRDGRAIYRLDFAWPQRRVGLEFDGAGHREQLQHRRDLERRAWLEQRGWRILAVTADEVYRNPARMIARLNTLLR